MTNIKIEVNIVFKNNIIIDNSVLVIHKNKQYFLVGPNGTGKTTLLNTIYNYLERESTIYIKQINYDVKDTAILDYLMCNDTLVYAAYKKIKEFEINNTESDEYIDLLNEYSDVIDKKIHLAKKILVGLGFKDKLTENTSTLSGGWKMRLELAAALYIEPEYLLLDEPTNHLDIYANLWLLNYLKTYKKTLICVSHDRQFINELATTLIIIYNKKLLTHVGNYDSYELLIQNKYNDELKKYTKFSKTLENMKKKNKDKNTIDDFIKTNSISKPKQPKPRITFVQPNILKNPLVKLEKVCYKIENSVIIKDLDLVINNDSKICIFGKNGVGKSTLLKLITKKLNQTSGKIEHNDILKIGYFEQNFESELDLKLTPILYLNNTEIHGTHKMLSYFGLEKTYFNVPISNLSGGQIAKTKFASLFMNKPHLLVLDEPTNHLDLPSIDLLVNAINTYLGSIILVTHNLYLLEKLNLDMYHFENSFLTKIKNLDELIFDS